MVAWLSSELGFPPVWQANADGLLAMGGDLRPERLLLAYSQGIFPWYGEDSPLLWWSPDPRCILPLDAVYCSKRLARKRQSSRFTCTYNTAFSKVIEHCAQSPRPNQDGTWITPAMQGAYRHLHTLGFAHSVECFEGSRLVGGLYGVAIGKAFFGESMFYLVPDASKIALLFLVDSLKEKGFMLFDCQQETKHMQNMGAVSIAREHFCALLEKALQP